MVNFAADVALFLESANLSQFTDDFLNAGFDNLEVLSEIASEDAAAILPRAGDRRRLAQAVEGLRGGRVGLGIDVGRAQNMANSTGNTSHRSRTAELLGKTQPPPMRRDVTGNDTAQTMRNVTVNLDEVNDDPDPVTLLVERLAVESHNRRVRVKDFFSPFDALKSGYVTLPQSTRALCATSLSISPGEIAMLQRAFSVKKTNFGGEQFDYAAFGEAFGERDLEKEPRRTARNPRSQLLHLDVVRGIAPPPRFIGTLDAEAPPVSPLPGNTTQRWAGAKDPGAKKPKPARNPTTREHATVASASAPLDKLTPAEKEAFVLVMKRLRAVVRQRGIVVKTLFRDYDRSRNGFVTRSQFRQSLPPLFGLTDAEAKMIMQKYTKTRFAEVDYMSFHEALESDEVPLHAPDLASATEPVTVGTRDLSKSELPAPMVPIAARDAATQAVMERLNVEVFERGIRIRDFLRPADTFLQGHLLPAKFQAGIVAAGLVVTELELLLLLLLLRRASDGKINYHRFCKQLETLDTGVPAEGVPMITAAGKTSTLAAVRVPERPAGTDAATGTLLARTSRSGIAVAQLLLRLQNRIARDRVRVLEFFRDYDTLRKGVVPRSKFRTALAQMGLNVTPAELRHLEERFTVAEVSAAEAARVLRQGPGSCNTGSTGTSESPAKAGGDVSYVEFCEWLDTAFTRPHLETTPTAPAPSWQPNESDPIYLTQDEADLLEVLLGRLANEVRVRGVVPKPVFADFDRTRRGTVSRNQFLQGLTFLSLRVGERETEVLCKRFGERHADGREDVRYAEFAKVLLELGEFYDE